MSENRRPRKQPTQARSKALVAAVVEGTEALVLEHGVGALTMPALARRAGVSLASVYEYFPSKGAVLAAWAESVWDRAFAAGFAALDDAIVVRRLPVSEGMAGVVVAFNSCLRVFARACAGLPFTTMVGRSERRVELYQALRSIIEGVIVGAPDVTAIRVRSAPLAARLLAGLITADTYMEFLATADDTAADAEVSDLFRRYLSGEQALTAPSLEPS